MLAGSITTQVNRQEAAANTGPPAAAAAGFDRALRQAQQQESEPQAAAEAVKTPTDGPGRNSATSTAPTAEPKPAAPEAVEQGQAAADQQQRSASQLRPGQAAARAETDRLPKIGLSPEAEADATAERRVFVRQPAVDRRGRSAGSQRSESETVVAADTETDTNAGNGRVAAADRHAAGRAAQGRKGQAAARQQPEKQDAKPGASQVDGQGMLVAALEQQRDRQQGPEEAQARLAAATGQLPAGEPPESAAASAETSPTKTTPPGRQLLDSRPAAPGTDQQAGKAGASADLPAATLLKDDAPPQSQAAAATLAATPRGEARTATPATGPALAAAPQLPVGTDAGLTAGELLTESGPAVRIEAGTPTLQAPGRGLPFAQLVESSLNQLLDGPQGAMVRQLNLQLHGQERAEIRLSLQPESLGEVRLHVRLHERSAVTQVRVDNQQAAQLMEGAMESFARSFNDSGYQQQHFEVLVTAAPEPGFTRSWSDAQAGTTGADFLFSQQTINYMA